VSTTHGQPYSARRNERSSVLPSVVSIICLSLFQMATAHPRRRIPRSTQDAIASRFLAELQDEQKWEALFVSTTDDQWDRMAAMVRQEIPREVLM
jgi:hypothetical protein